MGKQRRTRHLPLDTLLVNYVNANDTWQVAVIKPRIVEGIYPPDAVKRHCRNEGGWHWEFDNCTYDYAAMPDTPWHDRVLAFLTAAALGHTDETILKEMLDHGQ